MIDWNVSLSRAGTFYSFIFNFVFFYALVSFSCFYSFLTFVYRKSITISGEFSATRHLLRHPTPEPLRCQVWPLPLTNTYLQLVPLPPYFEFSNLANSIYRTILTSEAYENIVSDFLGIVQNQHSSMQNFSATRGPQSRAIEIQKWGFLLHLLRSVAYVDFKTQVCITRGEEGRRGPDRREGEGRKEGGREGVEGDVWLSSDDFLMPNIHSLTCMLGPPANSEHLREVLWLRASDSLSSRATQLRLLEGQRSLCSPTRYHGNDEDQVQAFSAGMWAFLSSSHIHMGWDGEGRFSISWKSSYGIYLSLFLPLFFGMLLLLCIGWFIFRSLRELLV